MVLFTFDIFLKIGRGVDLANQDQLRFGLLNVACMQNNHSQLGHSSYQPNFIHNVRPNNHGYNKISEHSAL